MIYASKIAIRYLASSKTQTALLIAGVSVGVFIFVFMSALISGLANYLVQRTVGDIAHIRLESPKREAGLLIDYQGIAQMVQQKASSQRNILRNAEAFLPRMEAMPDVKAVSPQVIGSGFVIRGESRAPVSVMGVEPNKVLAISNLQRGIVSGNTQLTNTNVIIGKTLADDLGLKLGQLIRLASERNQERILTVTGIYEMGIEALDARSVFVSISTARTLLDLQHGVSRIEIKLHDLNAANTFAERVASETGLRATPWTTGNAQLLEGLQAQARSGDLIKGFALITIVIGVASSLLLSTYRRSSEIGIMRAFGASRDFVILVFVLQGVLIGLLGGFIGAALGYLALLPFPLPESGQPNGLPVDVRQGDYLLAITFTLIASVLASILPARAAASVDPVSVIGQ